MQDWDDQRLVGAAVAGDRDAFAALIDRHYERIHRLAWRWLGSRGEAEDVAQDVVVKLARALKNFRGEAAFSTWLHRITYTTATDRLRQRQRIVVLPPSDIVMLFDAGPHATEPARDDATELWEQVRALPDMQRDAVLLVYGEELSHRAAADILGIAESTVSYHLHEARKRLKSRLLATG